MALAHLLSDLSRAGNRAFHALIVDHALRAESGQEARVTADRAAALGAVPHILTWQTPRRSQAAARTARHRMLASACREIGAQRLFLAHTREDRIETLQMRLARRSGGRSLAAMGELDPSPAWPQGRGLVLARPLLETRRDDLRAFLTARGADWIEDPSNADPRYERVRLRLAQSQQGDEFTTRLLRLGAAARAFEQEVTMAAARLLSRGADPLAWGGLALKRDVFAEAPARVARRAMEMSMLAVSGQADLPGPARIRVLHAALRAGAQASSAGVLLTDAGILGRDPGAVTGRADGTPGAPPLDLKPGETGVFDARFEITAHQAISVLPAGRDAGEGLQAVPAVFRSGLPAFRIGTGEVFAALSPEAHRYGTLRPLTGARLRHLAFPFAGAAWFDGD